MIIILISVAVAFYGLLYLYLRKEHKRNLQNRAQYLEREIKDTEQYLQDLKEELRGLSSDL
jgi:F0F1-type ATP synthase membrane subunit b/b'